MRLVFTTWAWPSHLYAMVPLAWACRAAGHEVLVASQPALIDTVLGTGLPAAPVGHDVDAEAVFRSIVSSPATGADPPKGPRVLALLAELAEAMVDDLVRVASGWRADAVVFEPTALAGPLAAAVLNIPAVRHLFGTDLVSAAGPFLVEALEPLSGRLGLQTADPFGVATIDPCPAGLQVPVGSRRVPVRYVPYNGPGVLPRLPARSDRPRVCVTWGTTLSRLDPDLFLAGQVAEAIHSLDVDILLAVTPGQRALLRSLPPSVTVVEGTPLQLVLPGCDLVIAHGGAATTLTALASGLPQVLVPRLPDHVRHASRVAEAGAATVLAAPVDDPAAIRDGTAEVLAAPGYRAAARRLGAQLNDQPLPGQLVRELERIAAGADAALSQPPATLQAGRRWSGHDAHG